jgi:hypothetical protein
MGVGGRISGGGWNIPKPYMRIYTGVYPLSGSKLLPGQSPGGPDASGQYLHFRFNGSLNVASRSGGLDPNANDFAPNQIAVEFDAVTCFTLPFCGYLELIGGSGEWSFWISPHDVTHAEFYQPQYRYLRTQLGEGQPFTIPANHTYLLGSSLNAVFTAPDGTELQPSLLLPGTQVIAGTVYTPRIATDILTGWYG